MGTNAHFVELQILATQTTVAVMEALAWSAKKRAFSQRRGWSAEAGEERLSAPPRKAGATHKPKRPSPSSGLGLLSDSAVS